MWHLVHQATRLLRAPAFQLLEMPTPPTVRIPNSSEAGLLSTALAGPVQSPCLPMSLALERGCNASDIASFAALYQALHAAQAADSCYGDLTQRGSQQRRHSLIRHQEGESHGPNGLGVRSGADLGKFDASIFQRCRALALGSLVVLAQPVQAVHHSEAPQHAQHVVLGLPLNAALGSLVALQARGC